MPVTIEAIREWLEEAGGSLDDKVYSVRRAFHKWYNDGLSWERMAWVLDVFEDHVMVSYGERVFRVDYTENSEVAGGYVFADTPWPEYVLRYVPATEAEPETADEETSEAVREAVSLTVQLAEASKDKAGLYPGSIIVVEGLSANNNHYTKEALESGVTIFEGARLVADHELEEGEKARPEGSVHDVIGKVTNARMSEVDGQNVLLGDVFISESETKIRTKVKEGILGDLSIRAWGSGKQGDDGTFVVEAFQSHPYTNIAMVTVGAAGGSLVSESQRVEDTPEPATENADEAQPVTEVRHLRESDTDQPENIELTEALNENARLLQENTQLFHEAREMRAETQIAEAISGVGDLPPVTLQRIAERVAHLKEAFATHGSEQTVEEFRAAVDAIVEAERTYLAQVTPNGAVAGLTQPGGEQPVEDILTEAFEDIVPAGTVKIAVRGRG